MAFSTSQSERRSCASLHSAALRRPVWQRGFRIAPIFNGLQPSKMSVALYRLAGCRKTAFFNSLLALDNTDDFEDFFLVRLDLRRHHNLRAQSFRGLIHEE
jgi:hypothetical protein